MGIDYSTTHGVIQEEVFNLSKIRETNRRATRGQTKPGSPDNGRTNGKREYKDQAF